MSEAPRIDRPGRGMASMLLATVAFVAMQAAVKHLRDHGAPTGLVLVLRTLPGMPVVAFALLRRGERLRPNVPREVLTRSLFGFFAMSTNFVATKFLSLVVFSGLYLSQPVIVAMASPLLLGERPGLRVLAALGLASVGALVLLSPGLADASAPVGASLLALASAAFSALAHVWVRKATAHDPSDRVVLWFGLFVTAVGLAWWLLGGDPGGAPYGLSWAALLGVGALSGAFGTLGQYAMTEAYRLSPATTVSVVSYLGIPLNMLADSLVFGLSPGAPALVGSALMVAAGLLLVRAHRA